MSLAMYAAPFNNENIDNDLYNNSTLDTPIQRKKLNHNKTQKRTSGPEYNSAKVNAVLQSLHTSQNEESDLGDYKLMPPPTSVGVENTKIKEGMTNQGSVQDYSSNDDVDIQSLNQNYLNDKAVEKYYKNLIPNYNQSVDKNEHNKQYYPNAYNSPLPSTENYTDLANKLNYMIHLLEEQQDERTNNVMEEVILYSFLGIFIIFIVDSFARVGKYVR
jgi:hypothetical protein